MAQKLPVLNRRPMSVEQRQHLVEAERIAAEGQQARERSGRSSSG